MRRYLLLLCLGTTYAQLRDSVVFQGMVVDELGSPIPGVSADHANLKTAWITGADGEFSMGTKAPAVVFRKSGYQPALVQVAPRSDLLVVLRKDRKGIADCFGREKCSYLGSGALCVPDVPGLKIAANIKDVDYRQRFWSLGNNTDAIAIQGAGPMWSFGVPQDSDVWSSTQYAETDHEYHGIPVIDARGVAGGKRWRFLGLPGESLSYRNLAESDATLADRLFDGVCMLPRI